MRHRWLMLFRALTTVAAGGCASSSPDQGSKVAIDSSVSSIKSSTEPNKDEVRYENPFDLPLEALFIDMAPYGVVVDRFVSACMQTEGFDYPAPDIDLSRAEPKAYSRLEHHALTEKSARELGYREEPDKRVQRPNPSDYAALSEEETEIYDFSLEKCISASLEVIPDFADAGNLVLQMDSASRSLAAENPLVVDLSTKWLSCMQDFGITTDLPETPPELVGTPEGFRIGVISAMDEIRRPDNLSTMLEKPTEDEVQIALHDVECRQVTDYETKYYQILAEIQLNMMAEKPSEIAQIDTSLDEIRRAVNSELQSSAY